MQEVGYFERRSDADDSVAESSSARPLKRKVLDLCHWSFLSGIICLIYSYLFWKRISPYWFHPNWTTDDGLQQLYPFLKVLHPQLFAGDLITEMVEGYLPPIHYGLSALVTWLTGSPVMMGHWLMLIQIVSALAFLFLAVRRAAGTAPAFFAVTWMLHTRHTMQRMTAGLPRGWSPLVFSAYLYFAMSGNHWGMLGTLLIGCLLHPPATFVIAIAYGLYLLFRVAMPETRKAHIKPLVRLLIASPLFLVITLVVLHRPEKIGEMVTYEEALHMPEFQKPFGRFPFVPLKPAAEEIKMFGFQAFVTRFYNPGRIWKTYRDTIVIASALLLIAVAVVRRRRAVPLAVITFFIASTIVYFASRVLAFKLYVPDRHLQIPFAYVWISLFSIGVWRVLLPSGFRFAISELKPFPRITNREALLPVLGLCVIAAMVLSAGGLGLNGAMNFNFERTKKGHAWNWLSDNTPLDSLVAGHPTHLDSVFLFGERQGYVTTETAHPFYRRYNEEMKRRLTISLRGHYARSLAELVSIVEPEGIDYFVFERKQFYPDVLAKATYFPPLDELMMELRAAPQGNYAYREIAAQFDVKQPPYVVFRDDQSVIVDIKKLKEFLGHEKK